MMRTAAKVDENHADIVKVLRQFPDVTVQSLAAVGKGCPDILVGIRGHTYLAEIKDGSKPPSHRTLTPDQVTWMANWSGGDVKMLTTVEEAVEWVRFVRAYQMVVNKTLRDR